MRGNASPTSRQRRNWLRLSLSALSSGAVGAAGWFGWRASRRPTADAPADAAANVNDTAINDTAANATAALLTQLIDVFLPRDDTAGGIDLGLHQQLQQAMNREAGADTALSLLAAALDRAAQQAHRSRFLALSALAQDALLRAWLPSLLARAGDSDDEKAARVLMVLRNRSMSLYYAQPESWPALGLAGPPQPLGYMDYAEPPART